MDTARDFIFAPRLDGGELVIRRSLVRSAVRHGSAVTIVYADEGVVKVACPDESEARSFIRRIAGLSA